MKHENPSAEIEKIIIRLCKHIDSEIKCIGTDNSSLSDLVKSLAMLINASQKCAVKLEKDYNRCSNPRSIDCERAVYDEDDIVCGYCGADTTYEKERKEKF